MRCGLSWLQILGDISRFLGFCLRPKTSLAAENLFLRKQLASYQERKVKPLRANNPTRLTLVLLSRWFNWRDALTIDARTFRRCTSLSGMIQSRHSHRRVPISRSQSVDHIPPWDQAFPSRGRAIFRSNPADIGFRCVIES